MGWLNVCCTPVGTGDLPACISLDNTNSPSCKSTSPVCGTNPPNCRLVKPLTPALTPSAALLTAPLIASLMLFHTPITLSPKSLIPCHISSILVWMAFCILINISSAIPGRVLRNACTFPGQQETLVVIHVQSCVSNAIAFVTKSLKIKATLIGSTAIHIIKLAIICGIATEIQPIKYPIENGSVDSQNSLHAVLTLVIKPAIPAIMSVIKVVIAPHISCTDKTILFAASWNINTIPSQ